MGAKEYIVGGMIGVVIGTIGMTVIDKEIFKPSQVYARDVNNDERKDLVVHWNRGDNKTVFIQEENGLYIRFDEFQKAQRQSIERKIK